MTITEGGYNIDKTSGEFMLGENNVKHDITTLVLLKPYSVLSPKDCAVVKKRAMVLLPYFHVIIFT